MARDCLIQYFDELIAAQKSDQEILPGVGLPKDVIIHRLEKAPSIPVTFEFSPAARFGTVELELEDDAGNKEKFSRTVPGDLPIEIPLPMGGYKLTVNTAPPLQVSHLKILPVAPPRFTWPVRAT